MTKDGNKHAVSWIAEKRSQLAQALHNRVDLGNVEIKDPISSRILDNIGDGIKGLADGGSLRPTVAAMTLLLVSGAGSSRQSSLSDHTESLPEKALTSDKPEALVYGRESTIEQVKDGNELESQIARMREKADEMGISNIHIIEDEGVSGKRFDRDGLKRLLRLATLENIEYVFVDELDRLGRRAAQALFITDLLEHELGVTVVTDNGKVNLDTRQGFAITVLHLITAEWENILKAKRSISGQLRAFENKDWTGYYNTAPLGYRLKTIDDEENKKWLIKKDEDRLDEAIVGLFEYFLETDDYGAYKQTKNHIESHYGDLFDDGISNIKKLLQNPVYIGKPTAYSDRLDEKVTVEDESLKYVDEDLFKKVQKKIERLDRKNVVDQMDQTLDIDRLTTIFGLLPVAESSPNVKLHCPECDEVMSSWEQTTLNCGSGERTVVRYKCKNENCSKQYKKFPGSKEMFKIENHGDLPPDY